MKLHVITIVLDGMPTLPSVFYSLQASKTDWHWYVSEGPSANVGCTSWCKPQPWRSSISPSKDGTSEFLDALKGHPRVSIQRSGYWQGKLPMFNAHVGDMKEPGVLMEIDADELWTPESLRGVVNLFSEYPHINRAYFWCRYFVGPDIVTDGENCYGANPGEWLRAWRYLPGWVFQRHEPPIFNGNQGSMLSRDFTRSRGLTFDHYAYAYRSQLEYKEKFYGYTDAPAHWDRLQRNEAWPCRLKTFLPWVDDRVQAFKLR